MIGSGLYNYSIMGRIMAKAMDVLLAAKKESEGALQDRDYNTYHMLTSEQIKAAALLRMGGADEAADKLYVAPVAEQKTPGGMSFNTYNNTYTNAITDSISAAQSGKPTFFNMVDGSHHAVVKLTQDPRSQDNPKKLLVSYYNSIPSAKVDENKKAERVKAQAAASQVAELTQDENLQMAEIYVNDEIARNARFSDLGREFAKQLLAHLKTKGLSSQGANVVDDSKDHQHNNCCGLAVADYIAGKEPKAGMSTQEREAYYKDMGQKTFEAIAEAKGPEAAIKASLQESQKIAVKQVEHDSDWVFVDSAATVKSEMDAAEIAAAVAQIDAVYVAQADSSTHTIAENVVNLAGIKPEDVKDKTQVLDALEKSGLLEEKDLQQITKELDQHMKSPPTTYSAKDLVALMQKTSFVRGQASAYGQFSPTSTPTVGGSRAPSQDQGRQ
jgi:hypothetical protein